MIDTTTEFGSRVARRLREEPIIWLTTVRDDFTPQPSPVWFWWDGATFLIYSQPATPKLRNIAARPKVALHFDSDGQGGNIVVFTGAAYIDDRTPAANEVPDYLAKYRDSIDRIGMTSSTFAQSFSVALRVTPTNLRGH
jgi:PPOX class probable F420-dependent enzyme